MQAAGEARRRRIETRYSNLDMDKPETTDPILLFREWLGEAERSEISDPNAVALATVGADGMPSARMVLLKGVDHGGFVFYTNTESHKGHDLAANPVAALCFHWKSLRRSVRVEGTVTPVSAAEADEYFASRDRGSKIGAWASDQSRPMGDGWELEKRVAKFTAKFGVGRIPRPPHWSGYRVIPLRIEFWRERPFRLHRRLLYHRDEANETGWRTELLFP